MVLLHILSQPMAKLCSSHFPCLNLMPQYSSTAEFGPVQVFWTCTVFSQAWPWSLFSGCRNSHSSWAYWTPQQGLQAAGGLGWVLLQILLCSSGSLLSTRMLIHALDSTSLPGNRPTSTTEILRRKPARFQRGLNLENLASSTDFVLSFLLQALRYQTDGTLTGGLTARQDTHRYCSACRDWVTPHAWAQCELSTTCIESSFQRLALTEKFKFYTKEYGCTPGFLLQIMI